MPTTVIFRRFYEGGELIALFPKIAADMNPANCMSYQRIGQHGSANYAGILRNSRAAILGPELKALELELIGIGYQLNIRLASPKGNEEWAADRREQLREFARSE